MTTTLTPADWEKWVSQLRSFATISIPTIQGFQKSVNLSASETTDVIGRTSRNQFHPWQVEAFCDFLPNKILMDLRKSILEELLAME